MVLQSIIYCQKYDVLIVGRFAIEWYSNLLDVWWNDIKTGGITVIVSINNQIIMSLSVM